jgi:leader peptidase (prepilin peptidase)/N-methyltransferase
MSSSQIMPEWPVVASAAVFLGLVFGSFVTALTFRLPRGESVAAGRSRCPNCGHALAVQDLVPIFSWLAGRGGCRYCRAPISPRYPIIETLSVGLFAATAFLVRDPLHLALGLVSVPPLLALAVIDFEHQRVPDVLVVAMVPLALAWRYFDDGAIGWGLAAGGLTLAVVVCIGLLFRGATGESGLGLGDAKLIALAALAFPPFAFFVFLAAASAAGLGLGVWWRRRTGQELFPFAVTITLAWWLCLVLQLPLKP